MAEKFLKSRAENTQEEVKCQRCGFMFEMAPTSSAERITTCPQCGEGIDLDHALLVYVSDEDY